MKYDEIWIIDIIDDPSIGLPSAITLSAMGFYLDFFHPKYHLLLEPCCFWPCYLGKGWSLISAIYGTDMFFPHEHSKIRKSAAKF